MPDAAELDVAPLRTGLPAWVPRPVGELSTEQVFGAAGLPAPPRRSRREFTTAEVFGPSQYEITTGEPDTPLYLVLPKTPAPAPQLRPQREFTTEEVFGGSAPVQGRREYSTAEVFGTGADNSFEAQQRAAQAALGITPEQADEALRLSDKQADLLAQQKMAREGVPMWKYLVSRTGPGARQTELGGDYWQGVADRIDALTYSTVEPLTRPMSGVAGRALDVGINAIAGAPQATPGAPGPLEEQLAQPTINLPRAETLTDEEAQALGWGTARMRATQAGAGVWNAAAGLVGMFSSPDAVALLPAGTDKRVLTAWLSQMAAHTPERVLKAAEYAREGRTQDAVEEIATGVAELGMAELGRRHMMRDPNAITAADVEGQPRLNINERGELVDTALPRPKEIQLRYPPVIRRPILNEAGEVVDVREGPTTASFKTDLEWDVFNRWRDRTRLAERAAKGPKPRMPEPEPAPLPELHETSAKLIDAIVNVARQARPQLADLYGAMEAVPTAKRILENTIARIEQAGGDAAATQPLYDKLAAIEKFENNYQETVTQPQRPGPGEAPRTEPTQPGTVTPAPAPAEPGTPKQGEFGFISGSPAEAWADQVIARSKTLGIKPVDPNQLFAAWVVKGAALLERGIRRFADWAPRMIAEHGPNIRPHLRRIYEQAAAGLAMRQAEKASQVGELPTAVHWSKAGGTSGHSSWDRVTPEKKQILGNLVRNSPIMRPVPGEPAHAVAERFINAVADNLVWLYHQMPEDLRQRAKLWYDGGHVMVRQLATEYRHSRAAVAGVIASLSPQTEWNRNMSLARRVLDIWDKQQRTRPTPEMRRAAVRIASEKDNPKPWRVRFDDFFRRNSHLRFEQMALKDKATFVRLYDEGHNPGHFELLSPEGEYGELARKKKKPGQAEGDLAKVGWKSFPEIGKALAILENPTREVISQKLGKKHKVRNFYNNLIDPTNRNAITVDTHAVAAGHLEPFGGGAKEVLRNFGGSGAPPDAGTGLSGTYPLYHEAHRRAAQRLGVGLLPRELQSITWEAGRGLFTPEFKRDKSKVAKVRQIWQRYRDGYITADEARFAIGQFAGGIRPPTWAGRTRGNRPVAPERAAAHEAELPGRSGLRGADRRGDGNEPAAAVSPEGKPVGEAGGAEEPGKTKGLISGTAAEAWADRTIARSKTLGIVPQDPNELIAAWIVKGAAIMERGVRRFADWAPRMIAEHGPEIRPHLRRIYQQASASLATAGNDSRELRQRKLAARGAVSAAVPPSHQQRLKTGREAFYEPQDMSRVEDTVGNLSNDELARVPVIQPDGPANLWTAAQLELYRRNVAAGNLDAAWQIMENAMKTGTSLGQLINQFKMLRGATPDGVVLAVNKRLQDTGHDPMRPAEQVRTRHLAEESIKANTTWKQAERAAKADPTEANVARAMAARQEAVAADVHLQRQIAAYQPKTFFDLLTTLLKGNLLAPISQAANVAGNTSNLLIRGGTRSAAAIVDTIDSFLRSRPRQATVAPVRGTIEAVKAIGRAAPESVRTLWRGASDAELGDKADVHRGLQPLVALRNLFKREVLGPERNGRTPFAQRLMMALEASPMGMHATAQLRLLGAVDKLYKEPTRARLIVEALKLRDMNRPEGAPKIYTPENAARAVKYPELFLDAGTMARIDQEAATAVYQNKNPLSQAINRALTAAKPSTRFLAATIAPYVTTPTNVIGEWMSYNPAIAGINTVRHALKGNARGAEIAAGKFITGSMALAAGYWLYKKGLISPSLDQSDEQQKARTLAGMTMPPNHVNLTGLQRALKGADPRWRKGDRSLDVLRAGGVAGALMLSATDIMRRRELQPAAGGADMAARIMGDQWTQMLQYGVNQSFLKGTANLLDAIQTGKLDSWAATYAEGLSSIPLPGTLTAASRAMRQFKPEVRGDSLDQRLENQLRNRLGIFGAADKLPFKRDLWGRPIRETPEGNLPWLYQMFDVSKGQRIPNDNVALLLYGLWRRTGEARVIPTPPDASFSLGRREFEPLTREQLSRLQELVGKARHQLAESILLNENFLNQSNDAKLATLERVWNAGAEEGKRQFWTERGQELKPRRPRAGFELEP